MMRIIAMFLIAAAATPAAAQTYPTWRAPKRRSPVQAMYAPGWTWPEARAKALADRSLTREKDKNDGRLS